jgi:hypothetical protein
MVPKGTGVLRLPRHKTRRPTTPIVTKPEISTGHHFKFTGAAPNAAILPPKETI